MVHQRNSVSSHQFDYTQDFPHNGGKPLEISYLVHPQMKHFDAAIDSVTKRSGSSNDKELSETFDLQAISAINAAQMQQQQQQQQQQPPFLLLHLLHHNSPYYHHNINNSRSNNNSNRNSLLVIDSIQTLLV